MARYARTIASEARASESERERERPGVALRKGVNHWGCCAGPTDLQYAVTQYFPLRVQPRDTTIVAKRGRATK